MDKSIQAEQNYRPGDYIFFDVAAGHDSMADYLAEETCRKLQSKKYGILKMTLVQSHTITVNEKRLENTVNIDRFSLADRGEEVSNSTDS